ncbi:MAG: hypothetical protein ACKO2P_19140 [Planctomycetota bacterium]
MTDRLTNHAAPENGLSEAAVDGLLRDFFRLEVPLSLKNLPARRPGPVVPLTSVRPRLAASRIAMMAAIGALAAVLLFTLSSPSVSPPKPGIANRTQPAAPAADATQELLPVSSNAGADARAVPVDENGLLLRETEEIQLNPEP